MPSFSGSYATCAEAFGEPKGETGNVALRSQSLTSESCLFAKGLPLLATDSHIDGRTRAPNMADLWSTVAAHLQEIGVWLPDSRQAVRIGGRLFIALLLGGLVGFERERAGRAAGLRTHMLVALGAALFTVIVMESVIGAADPNARAEMLSQVVRGIAAGVGFLGAGAILKRAETEHIRGLTTAAGIWMTAAAGVAVGSGWIWPAAAAVILSWAILHLAPQVSVRKKENKPS